MACGDFNMNRINPLHIGILLVVTLLFLVFNLSRAKSELVEAKELHKETLALATHLSELKEVYDDKEKVKKSLSKILEQPSLKSAKIVQEVKNSGITLSSEEIDADILNALMSKLLNGSYNIGALDIKKISQTNATLFVEVLW